jgi:hypothetical protein
MMIMLPLTKDFDAAFSERFKEVTVQLALYQGGQQSNSVQIGPTVCLTA